MAEAPRNRPGQKTSFRWYVLALMFTLYTCAFADRANIGMALPYIKEEFSLTNGQAGLLVSLFAMSYAVCQVPAGLLVRRFGTRRVVPVFMSLTALATAFTGMTSSVFAMQVSRLFLGIVEAPLPIGMSASLNNWFSPREKGTAAGIFITAGKFAPVIVPLIGAFVIAHYGWRSVFFVFAVPTVILGICWALLVPDRPGESRFVSPAEAEHIETAGTASIAPLVQGTSINDGFAQLDAVIRARAVEPLDTMRDVFRSWTVWGLSLSYLLVQGIIGVILFLLPLYLTEEKDFSAINVGLVSAAPFAGGVIGNLAGGIISDRVFGGRRKPMMLVTFASTIFTMWILTAAPSGVVPLAFLLFVTGILLTAGYAGYAVYAAPMTTRAGFPLVAALVNTMGQAGTALVPLSIGFALDRYEWGVMFGALSISSAVGFAILLTIVEPRYPGSAKASRETKAAAPNPQL